MKNCPFCSIDKRRIILENKTVLVIRDRFPVSPGHALIIPKRHIPSFFETNKDERDAIVEALEKSKRILDKEFSPDGYNIGINDGIMAGQTVMHLHIHVIPRYKGDSRDPRGGVRWIFPDKARYWKE
ncbi:MAG: HIT family hydrolase [Deltaproteobacteria bacterium RBG_13_52_11b]|nr:MAG: HIT family hydrolase [Deltaproteobacteria bacterium RBG_13_52_11b]